MFTYVIIFKDYVAPGFIEIFIMDWLLIQLLKIIILQEIKLFDKRPYATKKLFYLFNNK